MPRPGRGATDFMSERQRMKAADLLHWEGGRSGAKRSSGVMAVKLIVYGGSGTQLRPEIDGWHAGNNVSKSIRESVIEMSTGSVGRLVSGGQGN